MCPECSRNNLDTAQHCVNCGAQLCGLLGAGTVLNQRYRVVKVLGCGGMGAVYLAEDLRLEQRPVAVKENFDTSATSQKQFMTEARILARLSHPNLPRVIDFFVGPTGKQYMVMDYIEGDDLLKIVERDGPQDLEETLRWFFQICDAVEYLHRQQPPIIHRDIKPGNIKIQPNNHATLVDFGIAKYYRPGQQTTAGAQAITPGFSPIEQYGQGITDQRSDIYSLGATLYYALTGVAPPDAIERLTHGKRLVPIRSINPDVSPQMERAIEKALGLRPDERYFSVRDFKRAIESARRQPPSTAVPPYQPYQQRSPYSHPSPSPSPHPRRRTHRRSWRTGPQPWQTSHTNVNGCLSAFLELLFWGFIAWAFGCCLTGLVLCLTFGFGTVWSTYVLFVHHNPMPLLILVILLLMILSARRHIANHRRHRRLP